MKKIFALTAILALVLGACDLLDPPPDEDIGEVTVQPTSLKISNHSSYKLFSVKYSSVNYDDIDIGGTSTKNVTANSPNPIYFDLSINNKRIQCRTNEVIICDQSNTEDKVITNNTAIATVTGGINGSLSSVYAALSKPILELSQNNTVIGNNDPIPFDFGNVELSSSKSFVFTIKNLGNLPLVLNGTPVILSSNSVFTIPSQPTNTSINPGASIAFLVLYTPTVEREDSGTITIMNNSDDLVFTLKIKGTGYVKKPQITIQQGNVIINQYGEYNFGAVLPGETKDVTFTIGNTGEVNLSFVTVNGNRINIFDDTDNAFSVIQQPSAAMIIAPGNTTTFILRFSPSVLGNNYIANVEIETNSKDTVFSFWIRGSCGQTVYQIGDTGPAGGIIFYDAGSVINGWRYLEAALIDFTAQWQINTSWSTSVGDTGFSIGSGKENTQIIVAYLNSRGQTGMAAQLCANMNVNGFNDWFLPSVDELNEMYKRKTILGMSGDYYWSSTEYDYEWAYSQDFYDGELFYDDEKYWVQSVRAIRAF
jgi:hypothetical protein